MASDEPFIRNEEAAQRAAGVGLIGKVLGTLGLDASGERARTSWGEALENTMLAPSLLNMLTDTYGAAQRLVETPFQPHDPQRSLDAFTVAGMAQTGALTGAPFRPAGSLGVGGSGTRPKPSIDRLGFYSQAEYAADHLIPMKSGTPQQWTNALKKHGVKDAELKWSGWDEFIKDKKALSRDDVRYFFNQNRPEVELWHLREGGLTEEGLRAHAYESYIESKLGDFDDRFEIVHDPDDDHHAWGFVDKESGERLLNAFFTEGAARRAAREVIEREAEEYSQGSLRMLVDELDEPLGSLWDDYRYNPTKADFGSYAESLYQWGKRGRQPPAPVRSGHWPFSNVLAHARGDLRTVYGPAGESVGTASHLDEIQSDWQQQGRKRGWAQASPEEVRRLQGAFALARAESERLAQLYKLVGVPSRSPEYWHVKDAVGVSDVMEELDRRLVDLDRLRRGIDLPEERNALMDESLRQRELSTLGRIEQLRQEAIKLGARPLSEEEAKNHSLALSDAHLREQEAWQRLNAAQRGVPESPFKDAEDFARLVLKAQLYEAARDPSVKWLSWSPGRVQVDRWGEEGLVPFYDKTIPGVLQKLMRQHDPQHPGVTEIAIDPPPPFKYRPGSQGASGYVQPFELHEPPTGVVFAPFALSRHAELQPAYSILAGASPEVFDQARFTHDGAAWGYFLRRRPEPLEEAAGAARDYEAVYPRGMSMHSGHLYGRFRDREHAERVMREAQEYFQNPPSAPTFPAVELTDSFRKNLLEKGWPLFSGHPASPFIGMVASGGMATGVPGIVTEEVY